MLQKITNHKYDLVAAENARVLGQVLEAMELYDRAIAGAKRKWIFSTKKH